MDSPATARLRRNSRLAMIIAGVFALLASFAVTAPAQAGYYGGYGYGYGSGSCGYRCGPCGYRCGYVPYRHYYHGCSSCGYRRSGVVYEKRYIERELVVRRYGYGGWGHPYRNHCGYSPCGYGGGYGGGYYRRPFPYGYGGVRDWGSPYGYGPSGYGYAEGGPRPLEPIPYGGEY